MGGEWGGWLGGEDYVLPYQELWWKVGSRDGPYDKGEETRAFEGKLKGGEEREGGGLYSNPVRCVRVQRVPPMKATSVRSSSEATSRIKANRIPLVNNPMEDSSGQDGGRVLPCV